MVCECIYIYISTHTCIHTYICVCVCVYACARSCVCVVRTHTHLFNNFTTLYVCVCIYIYIYTHTYIYDYTRHVIFCSVRYMAVQAEGFVWSELCMESVTNQICRLNEDAFQSRFILKVRKTCRGGKSREKRNVIIINCVSETWDTWKSCCHSYRQ